MRVIVDFGACMSNGECVAAAPEVFRLDDDGVLHVDDASPSEDLRARVEEAALMCPTQAIRIDDDA